MELVDQKAVLLTVKNPDRFTSAIEQCVSLGEVADGIHELLVKWNIENSIALTQMGIKNVPSTIHKDYKWSGRFVPMEHQKDTAGFIVNNPKCFVLSEQGCVDSDTEYLTPTGWKRISEYTGGMVAQYHPESGRAEFVEPEGYVKLPCSYMVRIKTKYGLDQLLSSEHRVLLVDGKQKKKQETTSAQEVLARHDAYHAGFKNKSGGCRSGTPTIAFSGMAIPTRFDLQGGLGLNLTDAELRLQIAVIADGYFGSKTNHCVVRLKRPRKIARFRTLLDASGVAYTETTPECKPAIGFHIFKFDAPLRVKEFNAQFWQCTEAQLRVVVDETLHWDGSTTNGRRFFSNSKQSADFVQYAFTVCGFTARITEDNHRKNKNYIVSIRKNQHLYLRGTTETVGPAQSTDGYKYCFTVPSTYLVFRRNGCIFCSGNTGKTGAAAWAIDYLMKKGLVKRVLVVCPLSIMKAAWQNDLFQVLPHRSVGIAHGTPKARRGVIEGNYEIVVINFDGIEIVLDEVKKAEFDMIIVDEANGLKNTQTRRWKVFKQINKPETRLVMMTGTPASQSPEDAFGLAKLVAPHRVPPYVSGWKDLVMQKVSTFKWVPKPRANDIVFNALQPAIRYTKEECLDLPDIVYVTREVPLTAQQTKYYEALRKQLLVETAGEEISAVNAAAKLSKLLQISVGSAYSDDGTTVNFDVSNRLNELESIIDESLQKVIVFAPFTHSIETIESFLTKRKISSMVINGAVPANKRAKIIDTFQNEVSPRVLIIQPQAAAHGITLTAANTIVWFGPTSSVETFLQANARAHRKGQNHKVTVIMIQGSPVEAKTYDMLTGKVTAQQNLIDMYNAVVKGIDIPK